MPLALQGRPVQEEKIREAFNTYIEDTMQRGGPTQTVDPYDSSDSEVTVQRKRRQSIYHKKGLSVSQMAGEVKQMI